MRKYFISTMALAIVMLTATPVLPQVLQYLGPSAGSCNGAGGLECMNQTCKETFPGSQVCTSEDIVRSGATGMPSASQRLHPKIVGVVYDGTDIVAVDYSGLSASPDELTCDG